MNLKKVIKNIEIINQDELSAIPDIEISGIAFDNRQIHTNYLFCALVGTDVDGHNYIPKAIEAGAIAIICQDDSFKNSYPNIIFIKVCNSRYASALAVHNFYNNPSENLDIIGITGTNGKTTSCFLIANMLKLLQENSNQLNNNKDIAIIGTTGIYFADEFIPSTHTTPESIELAKIILKMNNKNIHTLVMEVSSHSLAQDRVSGIEFEAALFTNLSHEHLDYHKTMLEYAKAKKILFDKLNHNSIAIAMYDPQYTDFILQDSIAKEKIIINYADSIINKSSANIAYKQVIITDYKLNTDFTEFSLKFTFLKDQPIYNFKTKLIGKFNIENMALAISYFVVKNYNINLISKILPKVEGAPGRMDRLILKNGSIAIVDYAHTPDALEKALMACKELLKDLPNSKLISVFGCGGDRDVKKRAIMGKISSEIADLTIITDDNPRTESPENIRKQIIEGILKNSNEFIEISPREEALKQATKIAKPNDIILIAGKGHENYQIIGKEKFHFDDKEIISNY